MKKKYIISVLALCATLLCSCATTQTSPIEIQTPEPTQTATSVPAARKFTEKKDALMEKLCAMYGLDFRLFKKIQDGAFNYQETIIDLPETISAEQVLIAKNLIKNDPELFFVNDIELSSDSLTIKLYYNVARESAEILGQELGRKIDYVISETINLENTKFENAISIYSYLSKNIDAVDNKSPNLYNLFVDGIGDSFDFARAMQFLLNQADIESYVTNSVEGDAWVTAKINDTYYHFSPYLDSLKSHGQNLEFFGATDVEMLNKYTMWLVQDGLIEISAEDTTFSHMRNITGYGVDFNEKVIYYIDKADENKIVKCTYFKDLKESVYNKRAQDMVYTNNVIYYADLDSRNKLYMLELSTGKNIELDTVYVTRMYARDGKLIYFDDISSTEGSIVIK